MVYFWGCAGCDLFCSGLAENSRCDPDHQGVLRHHLLLSHLFPTSCSSRRCLGAKSASAQFHNRSSDVLGLGKDNWEMLLSCNLGRLPSSAVGSALPSPRIALFTELTSSPQQPCSCLPRATHSYHGGEKPLPLQALFLSAVPFTPLWCPHVLLLGELDSVNT